MRLDNPMFTRVLAPTPFTLEATRDVGKVSDACHEPCEVKTEDELDAIQPSVAIMAAVMSR